MDACSGHNGEWILHSYIILIVHQLSCCQLLRCGGHQKCNSSILLVFSDVYDFVCPRLTYSTCPTCRNNLNKAQSADSTTASCGMLCLQSLAPAILRLLVKELFAFMITAPFAGFWSERYWKRTKPTPLLLAPSMKSLNFLWMGSTASRAWHSYGKT